MYDVNIAGEVVSKKIMCCLIKKNDDDEIVSIGVE
jgi:hypothetical protein